MTTKTELQDAVRFAKAALTNAQSDLAAFESKPENHVFATLEEADATIEDLLGDRARAACEGSYNCGSPTYEQGFFVDDVEYLGIAKFEYNRHDKTYYYVEESSYSSSPVTESEAA